MGQSVIPDTLIVGGGIGGLTLAAALGRLGGKVRLVEQAPAFEPVGAGITIQANGHAVLRALGIALPDADVVPIGAVEVIDHRGRVLTGGNPDEILPEPPSVNIHRADLHRVLLDACGGLTLETGRRVRAVRPGTGAVSVDFEDGGAEEAELVIGADGIGSSVRRSLLHDDSELRYSGQTCWRFALEAPELVPKITTERWYGGRRAGIVPLSRGRVYVFLVESAARHSPGPGTNAPDAVRARFQGLDPELDVVLERLDARTPINHDDLCDREGACFGAERVVLIGDAAHAMTPNAGQGAGTAIEDAGVLALHLGAKGAKAEDLASRLEAKQRDRVQRVQSLAWRAGRLAHWRHPAARFVRDLAMRAVPPRVVDAQARALWQPGLEIAAEIEGSGLFG